MLTRPASTHSKIHVPVVPSSMIGRTGGTLPGTDEGFFEGLFDDDDDDDDERGPDVGGRDGADAGFPESAAGGPEARSVSLVGAMAAEAAGAAEVATGVGTTPMAGCVTANASVPAGDVMNALGESETMSSGRARACMIAAASADADG
jgi:hypothetical protein